MPVRIIVNVGFNLPAQLTRHPNFEVQRARDIIKRSLGGQPQIVTTHSQAFVNELGSQISYARLTRDEVEIRIHPGETVGSDFVTCMFDREGCLANWPYDFFSGYSDTDGTNPYAGAGDSILSL